MAIDMPEPGSGVVSDPVCCPGYDPQAVTDWLAAADHTLDRMIADIATPILTSIGSAVSTTSSLIGDVVGSIDNFIDAQEKTALKCQTRIDQQIGQAYGGAVYDAGRIGVVYPTNEQVRMGNQTGQYLSYCTLNPQLCADGIPLILQAAVNAANAAALAAQPPEKTIKSQAENFADAEKLGHFVPFLQNAPTPGQPGQPGQPGAPGAPGAPGMASASALGLGGTASSAASSTANVTVNVPGYIPGGPQAKAAEPEKLPMPKDLSSTILGPFLDFLLSNTPGGPGYGGTQKQDEKKKSGVGPALTDAPLPDWNSLFACEDLTRRLNVLREAGEKMPDGLGFEGSGSTKKMPAWFKGIYDGLPSLVDDAAFATAKAIAGMMSATVKRLAGVTGCNVFELVIPSIVSLISGLLGRWVSPEFQRLLRPYELTARAVCPQEIPTPSEANRAFLANEINYETWKCWVRAGDQRNVPYETVMQADRTKIHVLDAIRLWKSKKITEEQYFKSIRASGVITATDRDLFEKTFLALPGVADIIRFMVRDVANDNVTLRFGMREGFEDNWKGRLQQYGDAQGVETDLARDYWMAHWYLPSFTQAAEMLHVLRPGSPRLKAFAKQLADQPGSEKNAAQWEASLAVSLDDLTALLKQDDMLPFWIPKLLASSYHSLTRVDTQRAFELNVLKRDQVKEGFKDLGYDEPNAEILTRTAETNKRRKRLNVLGVPTAKSVTAAYARNEISLPAFRLRLQTLEFTKEEIDLAEEFAKQQQSIRLTKLRLRVLKRRLFNGSVNLQETRGNLIQLDFDPAQAMRIVEEWDLERMGKEKAITASMLCKWRDRNIIGRDDQVRRLVGAGFAANDAVNIADDCEKGLSERNIKKMMAELRRIENERKRAAAEADRKAKAAAKYADSETVSEHRIREKIARALETQAATDDLAAEAASVPVDQSTADGQGDLG